MRWLRGITYLSSDFRTRVPHTPGSILESFPIVAVLAPGSDRSFLSSASYSYRRSILIQISVCDRGIVRTLSIYKFIANIGIAYP
jgi:hypothetical protein